MKNNLDISKETKMKIKNNAEYLFNKELLEIDQKEKDINKFIVAAGIFGPLLAVFQAIKIFATQNASGVSLLYWASYLIIASAWMSYGIYYKNKTIMISYGLWIIVEIAILNGIILFS